MRGGQMIEVILFWTLSAFAVVSALAVVFLRKPVDSVLSLLAFMLGIAGLFVLLGAGLVGLFQVIVYVGAVLVLFVFVVMLLNLNESRELGPVSLSRIAAAVTSVLLTSGILALLWLALQHSGLAVQHAVLKPALSIREIAVDLFGRHLLIFELTSVVLLAAAAGAIVISRKEGERS